MAVNTFNPKTGVYTPVSPAVQALKDAAAKNSGDPNIVRASSAPAGSTQSAQDYINKTGGTAAYVANQQAKQAAAQASGDTSMLAKLQADSARTGLSYAPASSTKSAQDWINNSASGQGGVDAYTKAQNEKMTNATNSGDTAMLDKLRADSQRTGLTYSVNQAAPPPETKVLDATNVVNNGGGGNSGGSNLSSGNANLINQQYDANYASQLQKLQEARQIQQQGLNQQETGVNQNALQNLNNNDAMATHQLKQLQEVQANNGVRGGDSITATIGNQTAQQQGANQINQDKMNQLTDIQQKRSLINNNASANDLALMQQLQASRSGQLIDNNNTQDQRSLQLAQLMGSYNGQQTLASRAQDQNYGLGLAGLTGNIGGQQTLQAQNQNFNQGLQTNQFNLQKDNQNFNQNMDTQKLKQAGEQFAKTMGLNYAQLSVQQQQVLGQLAIGQQNANTNATQANNSFTLGNRNADIAQQNANSESKLRDSQAVYYSDKGNSLTNKQDQLDLKAFNTERDGMLNSVRTGKVDIPTAMAQINQDEALGVYAPDLAEKLRSNLRVISGNVDVPGDPKTTNIKIDLSKLALNGNKSVTDSVRR